MASLRASSRLQFTESPISAPRFTGRTLVHLPGRTISLCRPAIHTAIGAELNRDGGGIGSRRRKRGSARKDAANDVMNQRDLEMADPFLEAHLRRAKEEGHQILADVETLLERASNPFGFVLEVAADANEYLRTHKVESLTRKPILKVISDRVNELVGEEVRDAYINDHPDFKEYE